MIKWNNTSKNQLPAHQQEVLIAVNGVNYISVYDANKKIFRTNELLETFFKAENSEILWVDYLQVAPQAINDRSDIFRGTEKKVKKKSKL